jgi:hypothetical protein
MPPGKEVPYGYHESTDPASSRKTGFFIFMGRNVFFLVAKVQEQEYVIPRNSILLQPGLRL